MKLKFFISIAMMTICSLSAMGQAKKPTLMVVPSDAWCKEHGFEQTFDNQGTLEQIPDYQAAVSTDKQLNAVISKIRNPPLQQVPYQRAPISSTDEASWSSKLASNLYLVTILGCSSPHGNTPFF